MHDRSNFLYTPLNGTPPPPAFPPGLDQVLYERFRMDMLEQSGGAVAVEVPPSPTIGSPDQPFAADSEEVSTEALRRKHEEMFVGLLLA